MKLFQYLGRKAVTAPLALGSAFIWLFVFSVWIGRGDAPDKEKALKQVIAKQETTAQEPERAKPEPAAAPPPAETAQAAKPPAELKQRSAAALQANRKTLERQGLDYMSTGHGLDDLPPIDGGSESVEAYITFSRLAGYKFAVYSPERKKYLGELRFGGSPEIVPLKLARGFSQRGRLVQHETLLRIAREAAEDENVRLYALCSNEWAAYLAGKILEAMKICGVWDRREVAAFEAQFEVRGSRPVAVFKRAILSSGKEIVINDSEG